MVRLVLVLGLLTVIGCAEALGSGGDRELAQGFTPCGDFLAPMGQTNTCHPNQYCADATFSECETGCLSSFNCAADQVCAKPPGEDVGTCQGKGRGDSAPTLAAGTTKCGDFMAPADPGYNVCEPNSYCEDPTFSECAPGCRSDVNCPSGLRCDNGECR